MPPDVVIVVVVLSMPWAVRRQCLAQLTAIALALLVAAPAAQSRPSRIISLIPAVTEILFAIGAGPQVVAVSSFDTYPPEVHTLERVGALLDPDLERILALKPDLVAVYGTQSDLRRQLDQAGVPYFAYEHAGLADVSTTIAALGARVGRSMEATRVVREIADGLADVRVRTSGRPRPRTMVVFGREALSIRGVYASGGVGFLHDMLTVAGGDNVFADVPRQLVQATAELILARAPEVILELRAGEIAPARREAETLVWRRLPSLPAVKSGRVHLISDPRTVVPGPRVVEGTRLIAQALHPDAFR